MRTSAVASAAGNRKEMPKDPNVASVLLGCHCSPSCRFRDATEAAAPPCADRHPALVLYGSRIECAPISKRERWIVIVYPLLADLVAMVEWIHNEETAD